MTPAERLKEIEFHLDDPSQGISGKEICWLIARVKHLTEALEWYANWDWTDKYVQPIYKKARKALEEE